MKPEMPVPPGWRAVVCFVDDNEPNFEERDVAGLSLSGAMRLSPLALDPQAGYVDICRFIRDTIHAAGLLLPPNKLFTDEIKTQLEKRARAKRTGGWQ